MTNKEIVELGVLIASIELNLSGIKVEFKRKEFFPNEKVDAMFIQELYVIVFNEDLVEHGNEDGLLKCAFHETRHAYQKACVEFPNLMSIDVSKEEVNKWKDEFDNYLDPSMNGYEGQLIERDAKRYAEEIFLNLYGEDDDDL